MRWMGTADFFWEIRLPAVVETMFVHFLASYVPLQKLTVAQFFHGHSCHAPEEADDYVAEGWCLHRVHGFDRNYRLDCEVLRWAPVRDGDSALHWTSTATQKPPALETVLVKTPAGTFCAIYVPPLEVEPLDFLRFDPGSGFKPELWQQAEDGLFFIKESWHVPSYCDNGKVLSFPLADEVKEWAVIPKTSTRGTSGVRMPTMEAQP